MAKVVSLLFNFLFLCCLTAGAQVVFNGNLEYWEPQDSDNTGKENPKGWTTRNHIDNNPQAIYCYQTSDSYSGQRAAVLQNVVNTNGISLASFMTLKSYDEEDEKNTGVAFNLRPYSLHFAYKYFTLDVAPDGFYKSAATIELSTYEEASGNRVVVGKGEYFITNKTNFYQPTEVVIEYFHDLEPDSMKITFNTSNNPNDEIRLTIDDVYLQMENNTVGSDEKVYPNQISVFPNPVNDWLRFINPMDFDSASILVYNTVGQLILDQPIEGTDGQIDCQKLNSGMYFYQIRQGDELLNSGKLMKGN